MNIKHVNDDTNNINLTEAKKSGNVIGQNDFITGRFSSIKNMPQRYDDYVTGWNASNFSPYRLMKQNCVTVKYIMYL